MNKTSDLLHIATLGRSVGLKGDMKLHINSDFPEQFVKGARFLLKDGDSVTLVNVNHQRNTVRLEGCDTPEVTKRYINAKLYTTYEATREACELDDGQFFWFDIVGCIVEEDGRELGRVMEIDRINIQDYLLIKTDDLLVAQGDPTTFLIPYQPPFIVHTEIASKRIEVEGCLDLLRAS